MRLKKRRSRILRALAKRMSGAEPGIHHLEMRGGADSSDVTALLDHLGEVAPDLQIGSIHVIGGGLKVFVRSIRGRRVRELPPRPPNDRRPPKTGRIQN